ncbi:ricin-type beta-trefoil lectin domain protein [Streptomyces canus]|uniref:Ricin-type beta-trefoil lectin domain protein n=1 Tax=Streptomyces canus TaxID=58343 RepID=A0A101RUL7_9ACTN|nr:MULTISPECIES: RICIN domain-containing protein [Streptomyces]KUN62043.1 ricin-type beta-trefoil lectin domain protein [Streptomyces canus]MDI5907371.1 RICIN domain-containing protein [Streptomyces sp. 12257]
MSTTRESARHRAAPRAQAITLLLALLAAAVALVLPASGQAHAISRASQTMYTPPSNAPSPGSLYPRAIRLQNSGSSNGTLLATFEQYSSGTPVFPIYRSTDNGNSWSQISSISDTHNGFGNRYQPFLYELPTQIGTFPASTILAAGNSIPNDLSSTELDLYASTDHGVSWSYVSSIAQGGRADVTNGETPVWEPFLMVSGSKLIVYYSDQRDPNHAQKIVHQTTTDGITWSSVVDDVAMPTYTNRPGMPVVAQLPNGNYVMTYEYGGASEADFAVYYKISSDPEAFGSVTGTVLRSTDGYVPTSAPYITWLPTGGPNGTLAVSAQSTTDLFLNTQNGASGAWTRIASTVPRGYSRGMVPLADGHSLAILSAGVVISTGENPVTYGTIDLGGGISDGATYTMSNANSHLMLAIAGGSTTNGINATQQNADNATDQQWKFVQQTSGYFKIFNVASGKVLGVQNQSTANGAKVLQWDDNGTLDHEWAIAPNQAGGFTATNRISGKYLEIPSASTTVGTAAGQWSNTGCACQRWNLTQTALPTLSTGQYRLVNKNSGKFLEIPGASTATGKQAGQWVNTANNCQLWTFQSQSGGAWTVKNVNSGLFLDNNGSTSAGAAVVQNASSTASSQKWTLTDAGGGYYKLVNSGSGLVADVASASTANGALIVQSADNGADDELWQVVRVN